MKRITRSGLIALFFALIIILPVFAVDITNAEYLTTVNILNAAASTKTNNAVIISGLSANAMIAGKMLNATATDLAFIDAAGNSIAIMPGWSSNPWCVYSDTISGYGVRTYGIYSSKVTGGDIVYFPGATGMSVADAAGLEPGSNFDFAISTMLETDLTSTNIIVTHVDNTNGGLVVKKGNNQQLKAMIITAGGGYPQIVGSPATGGGTAASFDVTIPANDAGDLLLVFLQAYNTTAINTPSGWTQLAQDVNGLVRMGYYYKIVTTTITTQTFTLAGSAYYAYMTYVIDDTSYLGVPVIGTAATGNSVNPDPPSLTTGFGNVKTLWFALQSDGGGVTVTAPASYENLLNATGGGSIIISASRRELQAATENPGTYTLSSACPWVAQTIGIQGASASAVTINSVTDNFYNIHVIEDGSKFWMTANALASSNISAVAVPNSTGNWLIGYSDTCLYISSVSLTVSGTMQGSWPWQYAATFADTSGHGNIATPTYRTTNTDAQVTSSIVSQQSLLTGSTPPATNSEGWNILTDAQKTALLTTPAGLYTEGGTTFPGGERVQHTADEARIPVELILYPLAIMSSIALGIFVMAKSHLPSQGVRGSLWLQSLTSGLAMVLWVFGGGGVISGWILIPFGIWVIISLIIRNPYNPITS